MTWGVTWGIGVVACLFVCAGVACGQEAEGELPSAGEPVTIRVAAWHLPGVRTSELMTGGTARVKLIAQVIQRMRPNVIMLTGIVRDEAGGPGVEGEGGGLNAARFVESYLAVPQAEGLVPMRYVAFMPRTNSGMASGLDLDASGRVEKTWVDERTAGLFSGYSGDAWGPGRYPGERGIAVLVDARLLLMEAAARTFRLMPWDYMPDAALPKAGEAGALGAEERKQVRLSSSTHVDVPITLPNGAEVHILGCSPIEVSATTPPLLARRQHDEVRFWADYVDGQSYIVDDAGVGGGLRGTDQSERPSFVIVGPLGSDAEDPASVKNPVGATLFAAARINSEIVPKGKDGSAATSSDGRRLEYVLPSTDLGIVAAGVWRGDVTDGEGRTVKAPGERWPVWMDVWVRAPLRPVTR